MSNKLKHQDFKLRIADQSIEQKSINKLDANCKREISVEHQ